MRPSQGKLSINRRILVAEDSLPQAEQLRALLEEDGYSVEVTRDGSQGLAAARADPPALVISDINMPQMDGFAFCRALKSDEALEDIPFILVTSLSNPRDVIGGLECGADNFITKPYDEGTLLERVNYLMANRRLRGSNRLSSGLRIEIDGQKHLITAEREQIVDMLMSAYAEASRFNEEARSRALLLAATNGTLHLLHRSAEALNQTRSESAALAAALESCQNLGSVKAAWIVLVDDDGIIRKIDSTAKFDSTAKTDGTGLPGGGGSVGPTSPARPSLPEALLSTELIGAADTKFQELLAHLAPDGRIEGGGCTVVPLVFGEHRHGVLGLVRKQPEPFPEADLRLLSTLGGQIAAAIHRVQVHERLEQAVAERTRQLRSEIAERTRMETLLRDAMESVAGGIAIYDSEERLIMHNTAYQSLFPEVAELIVPGVRFDELARASVAKRISLDAGGDADEQVADALRQFREHERTVETRLIDGRCVLVVNRRMANGWTAGLRIDVTELREIQKREDELRQQLTQSQKIEAIGNLTGGMAHDFNNLLGIIIGNLDMLREARKDDPDADELAREALEAAIRGADLTRRLLAFARRQPLQPKQTDVCDLVAGIITLLRRVIGEDVEIVLAPETGVWPVIVDPAQLEASITNLATNARDAMPHGGRLTIVIGNRHLDRHAAAMHAELTAGDYAMIEVSDTGSGMPPEIISRIFDPFFTTKEQGKGTGLGLSMVFGFMKQSGGHINVYSEPGIGTTIRLYLPRAAAAGITRDAAVEDEEPRGQGEIVLIVEDNAGMRRVVSRQMRELGYAVIEVENAAEALDLLSRERVDLLLSDIVMPGELNGIELAHIAKDRWPQLRTILTSGFSGGNADTGCSLLIKPYRKADLARALRDSLHG